MDIKAIPRYSQARGRFGDMIDGKCVLIAGEDVVCRIFGHKPHGFYQQMAFITLYAPTASLMSAWKNDVGDMKGTFPGAGFEPGSFEGESPCILRRRAFVFLHQQTLKHWDPNTHVSISNFNVHYNRRSTHNKWYIKQRIDYMYKQTRNKIQNHIWYIWSITHATSSITRNLHNSTLRTSPRMPPQITQDAKSLAASTNKGFCTGMTVQMGLKARGTGEAFGTVWAGVS